jgi:hypothetical protein
MAGIDEANLEKVECPDSSLKARAHRNLQEAAPDLVD